MTSSIRRLAALFVVCLMMPQILRGYDGLQDNIPNNVRRIPELGVEVPAQRADAMRAQLKVLQDKIASIQDSKDAGRIALLSDVMIFERAVRCALDYQEFFDVKEFDKADALLLEGIRRADQLQAGKPEWITQKGLVVRGYISRIDNTVQPYGLVIPPTYAIDHSVPTRCDIWFHGRGEKLSEVNFLWDRMKNPGEFTPDHTIMLHPYGRYCNAFKFAGEVDVLEALDDVQKRYRIDEDRISVRGFSMGGAACWQFATHYADRWFAANPGAGFSETPQFLKVFQKEELKPTPWEQTLWNLYDCDKWALNLTHCPTIAYSGENDSQKQAADVMEKALAEQDFSVRLKHIVGKGMGHKYDSASKLQVEDSLLALARFDRDPTPNPQHFATYSLKYNRGNWITVHAIEEHWKKAKITGMFKKDGKDLSDDHFAEPPNSLPDLKLPTLFLFVKNVSDLEVTLPAGQTLIAPETAQVRIVVQEFVDGPDAARPELGMTMINEARLSASGPYSDRSWSVRIAKRQTREAKSDPIEHSNSRIANRSALPAPGQLEEGNGWSIETADPPGLRKRHNVQGPIDDAFMDSFIFVRPTGTAANEAAGKWAETELARAIEHWRRHFRGDARVVNDVDLTDEMVQTSNIVLWGDPKSNSVLSKIADKLPIKWTAESITVKDKTYNAKTHAPILIYPNPLNPNRYVVLNSSFTFRDYAYLNNARQVPMLPDWAIIDLTTTPNAVWPGKVVDADFFDEKWELK